MGLVGVRTEDGFRTHFRTGSARRVLLHLALKEGSPLARSEIAELVWPGKEESAARTSLRTALASLRRMGAEIEADKDRVRLISDTDLGLFRRLVRRGDWLGASLAYGGLFSPGEDDPLLVGAALEYEKSFLRALHEASDARAVQQIDLDRLVFSSPAAAERARHSAAGRDKAVAHGLPESAHPLPLIGRSAWLERILSSIHTDHWATLVAPGGSGKTRLALEAARRAVASGTSVLWISLESRGPEDACSLVLGDALRLEAVTGLDPLLQAEHFLRGRKWVIVVDGAEEKENLCLEIAGLGHRNPALSFLFTSRQPLRGVPGSVHVLPMLELDPTEEEETGPACSLLRAAARSHQAPEDRLSPAILRDIAIRLGGHPLALLLASAQLGADWSGHQLARLTHRLGSLHRPGSQMGDRHADLSAVMNWTLDECSQSLRESLVFLALFRSGFDGSVVSPDLLSEMLRLGVAHKNQAGLWRLIEPLRNLLLQQEGAQGLAEERRRYGHYWACRGEEARRVSYSSAEHQVFGRLDVERENIEAALEILQATDAPRFVQASADFSWFWVMRGRFSQGIHWGRQALEAEPDQRHRARLLQMTGLSLLCSARLWEAEETLVAALELSLKLDDQPRAALARLNLATLYCESGRPEMASTLLPLALAGLQLDHLPGRQALGKVVAALIFNRLQRHEDAIEQAESAHKAMTELGYVWGIGSALNELGSALASLGKYEAAAQIQLESIKARRTTGFMRGVAVAQVDRSRCLIQMGRNDEAREALQEALRLYEEVGDRWGQARALRAASELARSEERDWDGLVLWAAADLADSSYGGTSTDNRKGPDWLETVDSANWAAARALARQASIIDLARARM